MLVYACIGKETRVVLAVKDFLKLKDKSDYDSYIFSETTSPEYLFVYPLYSSKTKIPDRLKRVCKIKAIKTFDKNLQESIKERERIHELCKKTLGYDLDDPFNSDLSIWGTK